MEKDPQPETPEFMFIKLMEAMNEELEENEVVSNPDAPTTRLERLDYLRRYIIGNPPLPYVATQYKDAFEQVLRKARSNYPLLVVESMVDRSHVSSVSTDVDQDFDGDDYAQRIHDFSGWEAFMSDLQTDLWNFGEAYARVLKPEETLAPGETESPAAGTEGIPPLFVVEDPRRCVGLENRRRPGQLEAWVKVWDDMDAGEDGEGQQVAIMYWQSVQFIARREEGAFTDAFDPEEWDWSSGIEGENPQTAFPELKGFGGVPVVKFRNKMDMGEFEPHIDLLDRITDCTLLGMIISWYQSFKQRAVIGNLDNGENLIEADEINSLIQDLRDGDTGEIKDLFQADPGALWLVPEGVKFWESGEAALDPLNNQRTGYLRELAAQTRTPLSMFANDGANQTAQGTEMQQKYHVDKIRDRQSRMKPGLMLLHQIAFAFAQEEPRTVGVRVTFDNPNHIPLADKASAMQQTSGILSRKRQLIEIWGMDPQAVRLNETELMQELLLAQSMAVDTTTTDVGSEDVSSEEESTSSSGASTESAAVEA